MEKYRKVKENINILLTFYLTKYYNFIMVMHKSVTGKGKKSLSDYYFSITFKKGGKNLKEAINLTKSGVSYDLSVSPHRTKVLYSAGKRIIFLFSSDLYRRKFEDRMEENRKTINDSLSNRFGFRVENNVLCDVRLYMTIEKRGFLLRYNREEFSCLGDLILDGKNLITKNSQE